MEMTKLDCDKLKQEIRRLDIFAINLKQEKLSPAQQQEIRNIRYRYQLLLCDDTHNSSEVIDQCWKDLNIISRNV